MKILKWLPRENAYEYAARVLLYNIIHLELKPGEEIRAVRLAEALSLSRMPVREALTELNRLGLVEIRPQRGSYITKIDPEVVEESGFMRLILEKEVVRLACGGISPASREALRKNIEQYRLLLEAGDTDSLLETDNEFHRLLFASVSKSWVYGRLREQMVQFDRLRMLTISSEASKADGTRQDHEAILDAVLTGNTEKAAEWTDRHLTHYRSEMAAARKQYPAYFIGK